MRVLFFVLRGKIVVASGSKARRRLKRYIGLGIVQSQHGNVVVLKQTAPMYIRQTEKLAIPDLSLSTEEVASPDLTVGQVLAINEAVERFAA